MSNALDLSAAEQRVAGRITPESARSVSISRGGGLVIRDMAEAMEFAKMMAIGGVSVPKHLRGNPGACLAVTIQALEWGMSPFAVANKSYSVNDRMAYEAQLLAAVVIQNGPFAELPTYSYSGEPGTTRVCTVTVKLNNGQVITHSSPEVGKIQPKNSPLWKTDEDQQEGYYTVRAMARRNFPHILLGANAPEDIVEEEAQAPRDITPVRQTTTQKLDQLAGTSSAQTVDTIDPDTGEVLQQEAEAPAAAPAASKPRARKAPDPKPEQQAPAPTQQQVAAAVADPLVQKTLETFPGSQVVDVRTNAGSEPEGASAEVWDDFDADDGPETAEDGVTPEEERIHMRMADLDHVPIGIDKDDIAQCRQYLAGYDAAVLGQPFNTCPIDLRVEARAVECAAWCRGHDTVTGDSYEARQARRKKK